MIASRYRAGSLERGHRAKQAALLRKKLSQAQNELRNSQCRLLISTVSSTFKMRLLLQTESAFATWRGNCRESNKVGKELRRVNLSILRACASALRAALRSMTMSQCAISSRKVLQRWQLNMQRAAASTQSLFVLLMVSCRLREGLARGMVQETLCCWRSHTVEAAVLELHRKSVQEAEQQQLAEVKRLDDALRVEAVRTKRHGDASTSREHQLGGRAVTSPPLPAKSIAHGRTRPRSQTTRLRGDLEQLPLLSLANTQHQEMANALRMNRRAVLASVASGKDSSEIWRVLLERDDSMPIHSLRVA